MKKTSRNKAVMVRMSDAELRSLHALTARFQDVMPGSFTQSDVLRQALKLLVEASAAGTFWKDVAGKLLAKKEVV
jgi:hypothetical protein